MIPATTSGEELRLYVASILCSELGRRMEYDARDIASRLPHEFGPFACGWNMLPNVILDRSPRVCVAWSLLLAEMRFDLAMERFQ
jgi:hypothetical protein